MSRDPLHPRLVGDIGGTSARFAMQLRAGDALSAVAEYPCADFGNLEAALRHYLAQHGLPAPQEMALGVATAVTAEHIVFVNNPWSFSRSALQQGLGLECLLVLNDFAALALSLPDLPPGQLRRIGGGEPQTAAPRVVVGPGTGLGLAALARGLDGRWVVISGEGGHGSIAALSEEQDQVLQLLRREFGHVSAERVLSGPGLVNLHRALSMLAGAAWRERTPSEVVVAARDGDELALGAVRLFSEFLGGFAGNQALSFGTLGGVYIGGGVAGRLGPLLDMVLLRQHFEAKGRLAAYLQPIPLWLIEAPQPALLGALRALDDRHETLEHEQFAGPSSSSGVTR